VNITFFNVISETTPVAIAIKGRNINNTNINWPKSIGDVYTERKIDRYPNNIDPRRTKIDLIRVAFIFACTSLPFKV
jgi:hypothetical protein